MKSLKNYGPLIILVLLIDTIAEIYRDAGFQNW